MNTSQPSLGAATHHEIVTQPHAWANALESVQQQLTALQRLWQDGDFDNVIFSGCGSTYYLSQAAAPLFQSLSGVSAQAAPASELLFYPQAHYPSRGRVLLIASSRSGATSETIAAVRAFRRQNRGRVIVITNYGDQPLAGLADLVIAIPRGQEQSVAQTRSFASMYVATTALSALLAQKPDLLQAMQELPAIGERLIAEYDGFARELGRDLRYDRFYFLGSGPRLGLASETNLKMKEMTLTHSEPFPFLEFRHGPMSMVSESAVIVGLLSENRRQPEQAVLDDMRKLGGRVISLAESEADIAFQSQLPETIRNVLYLPVLQLVAYYRALAKGLDPDHPTHLSAVIELETLG